MLDAAASGPSQGPGTVCHPQGRRHCQDLRGRTALAIRCPQSDGWACHMSAHSLAVAGTSCPLLPARKQDLSSVSPYPQPNGPVLPAASGLQGSSQGQRPSPTHVLLGDPPQPPCLTLWALTLKQVLLGSNPHLSLHLYEAQNIKSQIPSHVKVTGGCPLLRDGVRCSSAIGRARGTGA